MPFNKSVNPAGRMEDFIRWCAVISAIAAVIGLIFIVIFYAGIGIFGPLNDVAYMTQILFTTPIVIYFHRRVAPEKKGRATAVTAIGVLSMGTVIILQALLILGVIPFLRQIGMLLIASCFGVVWFGSIERLGKEDEVIPQGKFLAVIAGMTIGYPIWAYRLHQNLQTTEEKMTVNLEVTV